MHISEFSYLAQYFCGHNVGSIPLYHNGTIAATVKIIRFSLICFCNISAALDREGLVKKYKGVGGGWVGTFEIVVDRKRMYFILHFLLT